jgi:hypothetical protein
MPGQTGDPDERLYERLLVEWYARRTVVDAYHRSLRFLVAHNGEAPTEHPELIEKLGVALAGLGQTNDQMRAYEQEHGAPNSK